MSSVPSVPSALPLARDVRGDVYRLTDQWSQLLTLLIEPVDEEQQAAHAAECHRAVGEMVQPTTDALELAVGAIRALESEAALVREEEKRLAARRQARAGAAADLRRAVGEALDTMGLRKLQTATSTLSRLKAPVRVEVDEGAELPDQYVVVTVRPDKKSLGEALKSGEQIAGARLVEGEPYLLMR